MDSERPRLIGTGSDYTSTSTLSRIGSDNHRFAPVIWMLSLFDGRIEGVHVHMEDGSIRQRLSV